MPEDGLERRVVDGSSLGGRFYAALSSRGGSDFASSSGIDTFCPRLFFCSEVCRDARNAVALVFFRCNHCENTVSLMSRCNIYPAVHARPYTLPHSGLAKRASGISYLKAR
jgi:hypothetical protein